MTLTCAGSKPGSLGKIGRSDAENDYHNKVVPAVKSRPDIFLPKHLDQWYTLERYHIMGSRILSRSFQVEKWDPSMTNDEENGGAPQTEMDVEGDHANPAEPDEGRNDDVEREHGGDSDSDGDDDDDAGDVAMVPMADMLNARFGCNNVCRPIRVFTNPLCTSYRRGYSTNNWSSKWRPLNRLGLGTRS